MHGAPRPEKGWNTSVDRARYWAQRAYFRMRALAHSRFARGVTRCQKQGHGLVPDSECLGRRLFVTTILRNSQDNHMTGFLYELDWQDQRVLRQVPLALAEGTRFWNPRGANRGGRGMAVLNGELLVGVAQRILRFDTNLNYLGAIENPYLGSVHGLAVANGSIWATSGLHDMVVNLDRHGNTRRVWKGHESRLLRRKFFLPHRTLNTVLDFPQESYIEHYVKYSAQELYHINALSLDDDAGLEVLLPRVRSVLRLIPEGEGFREEIRFTDPRIPLGHDLVRWKGHYLINDTHRQQVRIYDKQGKLVKLLATDMAPVTDRARQFLTGGWQRGLVHLHGSVFLVSTSPAMVFELDVESGHIGRVLRIDEDINNCPSNILVTSELPLPCIEAAPANAERIPMESTPL